MTLEPLDAADQDRLERLRQAAGLEVPVPALADPLVVAAVGVVCAGRLVQAALARLTTEVYLLTDRSVGTPQARWQRLLALHAAMEAVLWRRGVADAHAWLPPPLARSFGRRLSRLGWVEESWPCWWRPVRRPAFLQEE